ncbi:phosphoadenosine phosphosulfate reductase [Loktanella sp. 3ANDIMAR09]|uniref:phosphoadenylyl-sulfate reductase n=1 Tax=Loktanella sp. 3ANDIMAR09 TaxID=1225657 RepID=UPI0006FDBE05|nr:phosphoadenylyl-sulfate reductase [Loktanella sp. 3ANDIMAR09]KQI68743.1 phosphoadenosine phosphosulfate reductase [Loktanella sp. 3ANDIMAR09]
MPLDNLSDRVTSLNEAYKHHSARAVLERALTDSQTGNLTLVSSFGAESVALLHMVSVLDRNLPVLFLDTEMLFAETLTYQMEVAERLHLGDVRVLHPDRDALLARDNEGLLHLSDPDGCCALRKTEPLMRALGEFDGWITGRKQYQGGQRKALPFFEADGDLLKVNPLAHWTRDDVQDYMVENRLPRHPLVAQGYPSIGCAPCTTKVAPGEDPRAGRWRNREKTECGIHFVDGKMVRIPAGAGL